MGGLEREKESESDGSTTRVNLKKERGGKKEEKVEERRVRSLRHRSDSVEQDAWVCACWLIYQGEWRGYPKIPKKSSKTSRL